MVWFAAVSVSVPSETVSETVCVPGETFSVRTIPSPTFDPSTFHV